MTYSKKYNLFQKNVVSTNFTFNKKGKGYVVTISLVTMYVSYSRN